MKTRVSLFIFCIQMNRGLADSPPNRRIVGNGNPETREIKISDYRQRLRSLAPLISSMNSRIKRLIYP